MITNKALKQIKSLAQKKYRKAHQQFVVEGVKSVEAFLAEGYQPLAVYATESLVSIEATLIKKGEMERITALKSPSPVLAVFSIPMQSLLPKKGRILVLDQLNDPGNLGTLIRLCDWFGISSIVCSLDTVDCYNPKVVQASMGSLSRVECHYTDLDHYFQQTSLPIYGTYMEGTSIYETTLPTDALLVFGSEANGISEGISDFIKHRLTIPRFSSPGPESLNIAVAASITLGILCQGTIQKLS